MKHLFFLIAVLFSFVAGAQKYQPALLYGKYENRMNVKTNLGIPNARYEVPDSEKGYPHICREDDVTYYWSPAAQEWVPESGSAGSGLNNYPTSFGWDALTGTLTLNRSGLTPITVSLDGRYLTLQEAVDDYFTKAESDARFAAIIHTHTPSEIIGLTTYVRNLFSAGSGLVYDADLGKFSFPGAGSGITSLNGLTDGIQTFATGTSGTDFNISSVGTAHTFNFPTVSSSARGLVTSTLFDTWNSKQDGISLTTTGTSGAATFDGTTLNIPQYSGASYTFQHSLVESGGAVNLDGDLASPGNNKVYGTDGSGVKGWYDKGTGADGNNYTTSASFSAATGDVTLARSGLSDLTFNLDGRYAIQAQSQCYGIIDPGVVTWSGSGLIFDVTPSIYNIGCETYTSTASQITLDAADPSNPRIDVIAVDNTGAVVKITGDAASNPVEPQVDPATQVYLTSVHIAAGATTPTGVSNVQIYNENTEWTTSTSGSITADFNATAAPQSGAKHVSVIASSSSARLIFTNASALNSSNYTALKLYVQLNGVLIGSQNMYVQFYNGNSTASTAKALDAYGLTKNSTGAYQSVSVPISSFTFTSTFDNVRIWTASGSGNYYIDNIQLQSGLTPAPPTSGLTNAYAIITDGTNSANASGGDKIKVRSSDNTVLATVGSNDATHGDNINLTVNGANLTGIPQSGVTNLTTDLSAKEDASNKSDNTSLGTSTTLYPTQNAVKAYVDAAVAGAGGYTDEQAQDAVGAMVSSEFTYTDATPSLALNAIAQSKITNLVSDLAAKQGTITLTTTGSSGAATFVGNTLNIPQYSGGTTYTFGNGVTESGGSVRFGQPFTTASDANYTVTSTDYAIILPTVTVNRTITLPDATTNSGRRLMFWNNNGGGFVWTYATTTKTPSGTTFTAFPNSTFMELVSNGIDWIKIEGATFYGADGTLLGNRTISGGSFYTQFNSTSSSGALRGNNTSSGAGVVGINTGTGYAGSFEKTAASTNTVESVLRVRRRTASTSANGLGGSIDFENMLSNGSNNVSAKIVSKLTDVTDATKKGNLEFYTLDGAPQVRMSISATGQINFTNVSEYTDNAAALSAGLVAGDVYRTGDTLKIVH